MTDITIMVYATGISVAFDAKPTTVAALKSSFPNAVWRPAERFWWIAGSSVEFSVHAWVREQTRIAEAGTRQASPPASCQCKTTPLGIEVRTPYDPRVVARLRAIPGAAWNAAARAWIVPPAEAEALRTALSDIEAWTGSAGQPKPPPTRFPALLANPPEIGVPLRRGPDVIVIERLGKPFFVSADMPAAWSELRGHEGKRCCYAYFRPATDAERATALKAAPSS